MNVYAYLSVPLDMSRLPSLAAPLDDGIASLDTRPDGRVKRSGHFFPMCHCHLLLLLRVCFVSEFQSQNEQVLIEKSKIP